MVRRMGVEPTRDNSYAPQGGVTLWLVLSDIVLSSNTKTIIILNIFSTQILSNSYSTVHNF